MLLFVNLLLLFLLGFSLLYLIAGNKLGWVEYMGLSLLVGMGQTGGVILLLDIFGGLPWRPWLTVSQLFLLLAWIGFPWKRKTLFSLGKIRSVLGDRPTYNFLFVLVLCLVLIFEYMNFYSTVMLPPYDRDGIVAFDVVGYVLSNEQTLKGLSIYQPEENPFIHSPGSCIAYAPFFQFLYAYVYWSGAANSKWIPALIFLFFLISVYGFSRRYMSPTSAIIMVFLVMVSPKMFEYSSYLLLNVMQTAFSTMGVLYSMKWLDSEAEDKKSYSLISAILFGISVFSRLESVAFPFAVGLCALYEVFRRRLSLRQISVWSVLVLFPLVVWMVFQKKSGLSTESFYVTHLFIDKGKFMEIVSGFIDNFENTLYYGNIFYISAAVVLISLIFFRRSKKSLYLLFVSGMSVVIYGLMLYHVEYKWDSLTNVLAYSSMRFFFSFIPLLYFALFVCYPVYGFSRWLDKKLSMGTPKLFTKR